MYLYVNRLFLLFCVLFTVLFCAVLLLVSDFLLWLARYHIRGENPPPFLRPEEMLVCFYATAAFVLGGVIGYWYVYLTGVLEVSLG